MPSWLPRKRLPSLSQARLTVSRHVPWPLRAAALLLTAVAGFGAGAFTMHALTADDAQSGAIAQEELSNANARLASLRVEFQQAQALANAADGKLKVEQSAVARLTQEVGRLEADNSRLAADLAYLERLLPSAGASEGEVGLRGFEVERGDAPGELRWRALVTQSGKTRKPFTGTIQLVATMTTAGRSGMVQWPAVGDQAAQAAARLEFQRMRRLQGKLEIPEGATIRNVQLRVLEGGSVRAQQTATP